MSSILHVHIHSIGDMHYYTFRDSSSSANVRVRVHRCTCRGCRCTCTCAELELQAWACMHVSVYMYSTSMSALQMCACMCVCVHVQYLHGGRSVIAIGDVLITTRPHTQYRRHALLHVYRYQLCKCVQPCVCVYMYSTCMVVEVSGHYWDVEVSALSDRLPIVHALHH